MAKACQICPNNNRPNEIFYNAKLQSGSWGYVCKACFETLAVYGNRCTVDENGVFTQTKELITNTPDKVKDILEELGIC